MSASNANSFTPRNGCLSALEHLRKRRTDLDLSEALTFFYVCQSEGITVSELAVLSHLTLSVVFRAARRLAAPDASETLAPCFGLIDIQPQPGEQRERTLVLTARGRMLKSEIDSITAKAKLPAVNPSTLKCLGLPPF